MYPQIPPSVLNAAPTIVHDNMVPSKKGDSPLGSFEHLQVPPIPVLLADTFGDRIAQSRVGGPPPDNAIINLEVGEKVNLHDVIATFDQS
jgi:hypothetical protein